MRVREQLIQCGRGRAHIRAEIRELEQQLAALNSVSLPPPPAKLRAR